MLRVLTRACLLLCLASCLSPVLFARARFWGYAEQGGKQVFTAGQPSSSPRVMGSFPGSTVTVRNPDNSLATLYSDLTGTAKSNPFTADSTGLWFFYADALTYNVTFSGTGISTPFTITVTDQSNYCGYDVQFATLAAAVANIPAYGCLNVIGTWTLATGVTIPANVTLYGQPGGSIKAGANGISLFTIGGDNVNLTGIHFSANSHTTVTAIRSSTRNNLTATYNYFDGAGMSGISMNSPAGTISSTGLNANHNRFTNMGVAIILFNIDQVRVENNYAANLTDDFFFANIYLGIFTNGATLSVTNNEGYNLGRMGVEWAGNGIRWIDFSHNTFYFSSTGGYCISGGSNANGGQGETGAVPTTVNTAAKTATYVSGPDFTRLTVGQQVIFGTTPYPDGTQATFITAISGTTLTVADTLLTKSGVVMSFDQLIGGSIDDNSCFSPGTTYTGSSFGIEPSGHSYVISNNKVYGKNNFTGFQYNGYDMKFLHNTVTSNGGPAASFANFGFNINLTAGNATQDNTFDDNACYNSQSGCIFAGFGGDIIRNNHDFRSFGFLSTDSTQGIYQSIALIATGTRPVLVEGNDSTILPPSNGATMASPGSFAWTCVSTSNIGPVIYQLNRCTNNSGTQFGQALYGGSFTYFNAWQDFGNIYTNLLYIGQQVGSLSSSTINYGNNNALSGATDFTTTAYFKTDPALPLTATRLIATTTIVSPSWNLGNNSFGSNTDSGGTLTLNGSGVATRAWTGTRVNGGYCVAGERNGQVVVQAVAGGGAFGLTLTASDGAASSGKVAQYICVFPEP